MEIIIAIVSIVGITALASLLNRVLPFTVCPVCAAVSGTWFWLTTAVVFHIFPREAYLPIILLLMGGTVTGIAYQAEKSIAWAKRRPLAFKAGIVVLGFPAAFWAATLVSPKTLAVEAAVMIMLFYFFFIRGVSRAPVRQADVSELEKKMKDCC